MTNRFTNDIYKITESQYHRERILCGNILQQHMESIKMKLSYWKRYLALVLVLALFVQILPQRIVHAADFTEETDELITVDAIAEEIPLRTENTKTFRMSDGSHTTVVYDTDVHYDAGNGNWEEIDNTLYPVRDEKTGAIVYSTKSNNYEISFAESLRDGRIYTYKDGRYSISFHLDLEEQGKETIPDEGVKEESVQTEVTEQESAAEESKPAEETIVEESSLEKAVTEESTTEESIAEEFLDEVSLSESEETIADESVLVESVIETENTESISEDISSKESVEESDDEEIIDSQIDEEIISESLAPEEIDKDEESEESSESNELNPDETSQNSVAMEVTTEKSNEEVTFEESIQEESSIEETEESINLEESDSEESAEELTEDSIAENPLTEEGPESSVESAAKAEIIEREEPEITYSSHLEELYTLKDSTSSLIYRNVRPNMDLQYELYGSTVKEKIIVQEKQTEYSYPFILQLEGLRVHQEKNGSISLYDPERVPADIKEGTEEYETAFEEAVVYVIPKPFMKDSSGIGQSQEVRYELGEQSEDGSIKITVIADSDWINADARIFPITIDPTIKKKEYVNTFDTHVIEGYPTTEYYASDTLIAGWASYDNYGRMRIYWKYKPLPTLPAASIVTNCQILLRQFAGGYSFYPGSESMNLAVREVTESWDLDAGLYWNNQPAFSSEILDFKTISSSTDATRYGLDITSLAQEWYAGTKANNGVVIFPATEYTSGNSSTTRACCSFGSCNYVGTLQPYIAVTYRDAKGLEGYWTTHSQSSPAGTGYINDFTGNLTFVHGDMSSIGGILPIGVNHVYNGYLASKNFTSGNAITADFSAMKTGAGWKLSAQETLVMYTLNNDDVSTTYCVHSDADGTEHYYQASGTNTYVSEDGLPYTITKNSSGYTMADDYGNVKTFDATGHLTMIQDVNGNYKSFVYSSNRLTAVKEKNAGGTERTILTFTYVNNYLSKITDALDTSDTITYSYSATPTGTVYSGSDLSNVGTTGYLRTIVHSKGETITFTYYSNGRLKEAISGTNKAKLLYEYASGGYLDGRVSKATEYGYNYTSNAYVAGQAIGVTYSGHKTTAFRTSGKDDVYGNSDDLVETCVMDNWGRTVCSYVNQNGSQVIIAAYNNSYQDNNTTTLRKRNTLLGTGDAGGWATSGNVSTNNLLNTTMQGSQTVTGNPSGTASKSQAVTLNLSGKQTYMLSGWAKATAVPKRDSDSPQKFELRAVITYSDNTTETKAIPFNTDVHVWQYVCGGIVPNISKTVSKITVYAAFDYQANSATFKMLRLVKEPAPTYKYNSNGDLTEIRNGDGSKQSLTYTGVDVTKIVDSDNESYTYTYRTVGSTNTHQVQSVSADGVTVNYTYDSYGNVTGATGTGTGVSSNVQTAAAYTNEGRFLSSSTNVVGKTTTYNTDTSTGQLQYMQDPKGNRTAYTYNVRNRLSSVWLDADKDQVLDSGETKIQYTYQHNLPLYLTTNSSRYHFAYDPYGNVSTIGVSGATGSAPVYTLATYGYNSNNGKLRSFTYGNGAVMNYTYDNMERLYQVKAGSTLRYTYTYNDDNQLAKIQDSLTGIVTNYTYDRIGRLTKEVTAYPAYGSIAANTVTTNYTYDSCGRCSGKSITTGGATRSYAAAFKANTSLLTSWTLPTSGHKITYTYDGLERITAKQIKNGSTVYAGNTYTYETVSSGRTSTRISQEVVNGSSTTYAYTYDANGNITTIKKNGTTLYTYTYDALNRLKTEAYGGSTYTYTYDAGGNITKVQKTTGSTTTTLGTYTYNSSWGDQLKSYNGTNFTYDNSGNPLTYYNGKSYTFTWTDGRRLATANAAGTSISYQYDVSGLRTGKTVGSARTRYYWENGRIIQENRNGTVIDYYYDENGDVIGIKYGGTVYYFGKNQQGDILEIHNGTTVVAKYTYNAWGEITSITDNNGNAIAPSATTNIANVNPFRYRGYYYDTDTGFYYLQSRYYDPVVKRFLNADGLTQIGSSENLLSYNLYVYCCNNPLVYVDENGLSYEIVGAGIQIELSGSFGNVGVSGGIEIIIYWGTEEAKANGGFVIAIYGYGSISADLVQSLEGMSDISDLLINNLDLLKMDGASAIDVIIESVSMKWDCSISGVLVTGNEDFNDVTDYKYGFDTCTVSGLSGKVSYSWSSCCKTISIGKKMNKTSFGINYSKSYYYLLAAYLPKGISLAEK